MEYILYFPRMPEVVTGRAKALITFLTDRGLNLKIVASYGECLSHGVQGYRGILADLKFNWDESQNGALFENFKKRQPDLKVLGYVENWNEHRPINHRADKVVYRDDYKNESLFRYGISNRLNELGLPSYEGDKKGEVLYYGQAAELQETDVPFALTEPTGAQPYGRRLRPSAGTATNQMALMLPDIRKHRAEEAAALIAVAEESGDDEAVEAAKKEAKEMTKSGKIVVQARLRAAMIGKSRAAGLHRR